MFLAKNDSFKKRSQAAGLEKFESDGPSDDSRNDNLSSLPTGK